MTHLQYWLRISGKTVTGLAREVGVSREAVSFLANPERPLRVYVEMRFDVLTAIFEATGIRPGTLIEDAMGLGEDVDATIQKVA
jgi:hypothetical protein